MARLSEHGIRLSSMSPSFLNSNSTSHTWPFSAVAELIDNASDPGVLAKQIWIDVAEESSLLCLTFTDNGSGMTPNKLHKMLSFGFTEKGSGKASQQAIGVYGNGFKSGSMRLGRDALIFTKNGGCQTVGMLSQTYLENIKAQAVIVPIVPFNQQTKSLVVTEDSEASLAAILQNSILTSLEQIHAHFDSIHSKKGTKILIWNIRRAKDGKPEIDFETDRSDFRLPDIQIEELKKGLRNGGSFRAQQNIPDMHYSLRAYLSILYLKPRTQIILRGRKILAKLVSKRLKHIEHDVYKPHFSKDKVKVTFGLNPKNRDHYGIMMYHKNRLIKAYEKVGCQLKTSGQRSGIGVIGVIECNFLKPAHNKQDFEYTKEYRLTLGALGLKLNNYWQEVTEKRAREREFQALDKEEDEDEQDTAKGPVWVQCEECLKWRSVPEGHYNVVPENWNCSQNPNLHYSCSSPEEAEDSEEQLTPSYQKNHRKPEHPKGRKRERSLEGPASQNQEATHQNLFRSSSEPSQPTHAPRHKITTDRYHTEANTLEPYEVNTDHRADHFKDTHRAPDATKTLNTATDEVPHTQQEPARVDEVIKTTDGPEHSHDEERDTSREAMETEEENPNLLSLKRKLGSLFSYANKKSCHVEEQPIGLGETNPETQRNKLWTSEGDSNSLGEKKGDTTQRTLTSLSWTHSLPSAQTVKVSPLSRTVSRSVPPEGSDREANMQKLAGLEKETQRLRRLLGLEVTKISQSTMTESESRGENQNGGLMKPLASTASNEVSCQTEEAESSCSSSSLAQAPRLQGPVIQGQRALYGSKEQPEQNGDRKERTETQSRISDSESCEDSRSTQENLLDIRKNVVVLLTALLPQLDLAGISLETSDVDSILQQIIEVNSLQI
ncbi:MORC family CW-type zinc finger protein 3 isoform X2 [Notolabrus celidotus]|uniref:MORC family CW-type zinc finger protein 3 isoform X2 n=1 Tax=Notolabrus celidotus TaxID=1203425 RepID=UPI00148FDDA5|nr:MORC family CW-type zinc finger protein 3 isoform X2 [Notolabrus celidotus]